ncbi:MAG: gamma-glutamyltransferase, partial [Spirochaetota bacterium]
MLGSTSKGLRVGIVVMAMVFGMLGGAPVLRSISAHDMTSVEIAEGRMEEPGATEAFTSDRIEQPRQYAVTSAHELATEAGLAMLEAGGTAADAAVAVASVLTIVEPWFSSVFGGGTWALYYDAERDEVTSLDGVGPAPNAISLEAMEGRGGDRGMHQAIVPGAWDGWMLWLDEFGRLELDQVIEPAIEAAEEGYAATPRLIQWLGINRRNHFQEPAFAHGREVYSEIEELGDIVYQPEQAETFRRVLEAYRESRAEGREQAIQAARDFVYRGPVAESIVAYSEEHDGFLALEDFADFEAEIVEPISVEYDDLTIYQNPPNSQGITQLILLKILEGFDLSEYSLDDADAVHLQVEAAKLAFADRHYHVGDPDFVDVPVAQLLSEEHIAARRQQISMDSVLEWPIEPLISRGEPESAGVAEGTGESAPDVSWYDSHSTTTFHIL